MDVGQNENAPAQGGAHGPVVWDRVEWYGAPGESDTADEGRRHIMFMLRWLWAHEMTTKLGDDAAKGQFSGALGREVALTSAMVTEDTAVFLDNYYGRWLTVLSEEGDVAYDDETVEGLWQDYRANRAELDRVWGV